MPHRQYNRVHLTQNTMPDAIMSYKCAIQLFKLYNANEYTFDWTLLNINQIFTSRQTTFIILKSNLTKVRLNLITNRLSVINRKISFSWLNSTITSFKLHCKKIVLDSLSGWQTPKSKLKMLLRFSGNDLSWGHDAINAARVLPPMAKIK